MSDQPNPAQPQAESTRDKVLAGDAPVAPAILPPTPTESGVPPAEAATPSSQLTPEEQMALFEKELRENDWGHQPC